jgi:hypothetical protein
MIFPFARSMVSLIVLLDPKLKGPHYFPSLFYGMSVPSVPVFSANPQYASDVSARHNPIIFNACSKFGIFLSL